VLTASDLNAEFNNILNNAPSLVSPLGGNLLFSPDNTYDIGASGATRPRNVFTAGNATIGGAVTVGDTTTLSGLATATAGAAFRGSTNPATGTHVEVRHNGTTGTILSYNRTGSAHSPLNISGSTLNLQVDEATIVSLSGGGLTLSDAKDFVFNATTGTKLGTATGQKIALWNATPIIQPSSVGETTGWTSGGGSAATSTDTYTGNSGTKAYTVNDVVKHLKAAGILAAS
jgi:hypothetical protein